MAQSMTTELRELRRELLADHIERQEAQVEALEREMRQARAEIQMAEEVQRAQNQELIQVDQRLSDPELSPEERSQLESVRAKATQQIRLIASTFRRRRRVARNFAVSVSAWNHCAVQPRPYWLRPWDLRTEYRR